MIGRALRLLLFRFLPRRIAPILLAWEALQLVRRFRAGRERPERVQPRRLRTVSESGRDDERTGRR
jgi:hypothetical protein